MDEKLIRSIGTKRPCREKCTPPDKRPKLNENQQIVLDYLKNECLENDLQYALWQFTDDVYEEPAMSVDLSAHIKAWKDETDKERFQILAALAEWGMKEVAE